MIRNNINGVILSGTKTHDFFQSAVNYKGMINIDFLIVWLLIFVISINFVFSNLFKIVNQLINIVQYCYFND